MRNEFMLVLFGFLLATAASPASAHGIEEIVQPLAIVAVVVGLIGGALTSALGIPRRTGVLTSMASYVAIVVLYLLLELSGPAADKFIRSLFAALIMIAFVGSIPLTLGFFSAASLSALAHKRFHRQTGNK